MGYLEQAKDGLRAVGARAGVGTKGRREGSDIAVSYRWEVQVIVAYEICIPA